jgi:hypothetical protein
MSPFMIEILLHYHWSTEDVEGLDQSPATNEACELFCELGILKRAPVGFSLTGSPIRYLANKPAIKVYVDALLAIPLPVMKWVIENKK